MSQGVVIWEKDGNHTDFKDCGIILPNTISMGTVTRRATEPTWMTASNPKKH
jgi:DNA polymerase gamma 1